MPKMGSIAGHKGFGARLDCRGEDRGVGQWNAVSSRHLLNLVGIRFRNDADRLEHGVEPLNTIGAFQHKVPADLPHRMVRGDQPTMTLSGQCDQGRTPAFGIPGRREHDIGVEE